MSRTWKSVIGGLVLAALASGCGATATGSTPTTGSSSTRVPTATRTSSTRPPQLLTARRLRPRPYAAAVGTLVPGSGVGLRVFANATVGFSMAGVSSAQYPVRTLDGGRTWRVDGPQFHVDAADAPEAVGYVGLIDARTYYAWGSSVDDVTTDGGRSWWETFVGGTVVAVVPGSKGDLLAYVQTEVVNSNPNRVVTWQYVSRDGGRHWRYTTTLGGN